MKPLPDLPDLRIVSTEHLSPHEQVEEARVQPIMRGLQADGILKNPPLVMALHTRQERYLVLDGANRTLALQSLDIPHALVQVVRPGKETVRLRTWNRLVYASDPRKLFDRLDAITEITPAPRDRKEQLERIAAGIRLAYLYLPDGSAWELGREREALHERMEQLGALITVCLDTGKTDRTSEMDVQSLTEVYDRFAGVLVFPSIEVEEVIEAVLEDIVLPAGLTRFIVSPRALRVNYPLDLLSKPRPIEEKQRHLEDWIQTRVHEHAVRYYAESTIVFDE
ncbi:MAG: hypothetical protein PVH92_00825 [Anaerolineales bacterium]